jgi:hypothetical protein
VLETQGIVDHDDQGVSYAGTLHLSRSDLSNDGQYWISQYLYEKFEYTCTGAVLLSSRATGMASPGYEPVQPATNTEEVKP